MSLNHKIIWNQLNCKDLDGAITFYSKLFDWTTVPEEKETYVHFYQGDKAVAGVMPQHGGGDAPANWAVHVGTTDLAAYCERAAKAGGRQLTPPIDIPSTGKLCAIADPAGAVLVAFEPADHSRESWGNTNIPGQFCWCELMSSKLDESLAFYREVVGWETMEMDMGGSRYFFVAPPNAAAGDAVGGAIDQPAPDVPDHWMPYICVKSAEATHSRALELGAQSCVKPSEIPGYGSFAVLMDPQGACFGVYQDAS